MGTKNNPGDFDCYANAHPDEPMFVLLGRDPHGGNSVRAWAAAYKRRKKAQGQWDERAIKKHDEAIVCAEQMDVWYVSGKRETEGGK